MKVIGLTGGIGAGKSTVTNYLRKQRLSRHRRRRHRPPDYRKGQPALKKNRPLLWCRSFV